MAAASSSRSRGVTGVRSTKGLFFIFTLLCVVCLATALTEDELVKQRNNFEKGQNILDEVKANVKVYQAMVTQLMMANDAQSEEIKDLEQANRKIRQAMVTQLMMANDAQSEEIKDLEQANRKIRQEINKRLVTIDKQHASMNRIELMQEEWKKNLKILEEYHSEL